LSKNQDLSDAVKDRYKQTNKLSTSNNKTRRVQFPTKKSGAINTRDLVVLVPEATVVDVNISQETRASGTDNTASLASLASLASPY
jgi:hypothetical protein